MPVTFLHTADFHFGANLKRFGPAAGDIEQAQIDALEKTLSHARRIDAEGLLICGDLFDSRTPRQSIVTAVISLLEQFPDTRIYILPGTHDYLSEACIYRKTDIWSRLPHVRLLDDRIQSPLRTESGNCLLYFKPNRSNRSQSSPFADICRESYGSFHIALGHGSLALGRPIMQDDFPINRDEIKRLRMDYLALGHWHSSRREQVDTTLVVYPGIPQPLSFSDPTVGEVVEITFSDNMPPRVTSIPVSTVKFMKIHEKLYHPQQLRTLLENSADPQTIIKLELIYSDNFNEYKEVDKIIGAFKKRFLVIQDDKIIDTINTAANLGESKDSDGVLIKKYQDELDRMKEADSPERSALYDRAAEVGAKLIKGELS